MVIADLSLRSEAHEVVQAYSDTKGSRNAQEGQAFFCRTDVSSWDDLSNAFKETKTRFGKVDIVCAGAGVFEPSWSNFWRPPGTDKSAIDSVSDSRFKSIDINLLHPIRLTQLAIIDHLQEMNSKKGTSELAPRKTIIHVSSVNGQVTPLWTPLYNVSKHGINGFVRSLAPLEKRLGIRVAAVAPGLVKTPLWSDSQDKNNPLSKDVNWVTSEEVADVMLSLVTKHQIHSHFREVEVEAQGAAVPIAGGSILEVSGDRIRDVKALLDPGPQGILPEDFNVSLMEEGVFQDLENMFRR